ncbi:hypothetical protein G646_gp147 [Serratia phage phiMAM1]|uniref:Uncharacterized protein n=1 Tax=Serratia phage phiMAM1 TaxID=1262513 RepID=K7YY38_9CAUD|nr:hypothetical protein G646_gp147 [Serratia phage phiMAM1]AFX93615.1 hypothetical protein MAM_147 [Serratia phage phiMAM1]
MPYILHSDTNQKFDITNKSAEDVQAELRAAGLVIGNVTVRKLVSGEMKQASGYEVVEDLTEEEQNEINEALAKVETEKALATNGADSELTSNVPETPKPGGTVLNEKSDLLDHALASLDATGDAPTAEVDEVETPEQAARAAEIRSRLLGADTGAAVSNVSAAAASKDDAALNTAQEALKAKNLTPQAAAEERSRRHNKREDLVEQARAGVQAELIKAVEDGVVPGVFLNYMNPDHRWFEFIITERADKEKPNARTNTYIDVAPIASGGYGFSLYVNGKSFTKRQKVKGTVAETVAEINKWLPEILKTVN